MSGEKITITLNPNKEDEPKDNIEIKDKTEENVLISNPATGDNIIIYIIAFITSIVGIVICTCKKKNEKIMKNSLKYKNNKGQIITGHTVQYLSISILKIVENLFILSYTNLNGHCDSSLVQLQFM